MEVVRLMGKERRKWADKATGELKEFCGLHVVYELFEEEEGMEGKKCDNITCPRGVDPASLAIGKCYELEYSHYKTKNGLAARVSGLKLVKE